VKPNASRQTSIAENRSFFFILETAFAVLMSRRHIINSHARVQSQDHKFTSELSSFIFDPCFFFFLDL
jgi:hypothetical protein